MALSEVLKNIWCGDPSLKDLFPDLFALAMDKGGLVASYLANTSKNGVRHCIPPFIQSFQDWKLESVSSFFELLYHNLPSSSGEYQALEFQTKKGCLRFDRSIMPLGHPQVFPCHGRAFGWPRSHKRCCSLPLCVDYGSRLYIDN